jgi:alkyl hydroperoxide reductase subunit AhpF
MTQTAFFEETLRTPIAYQCGVVVCGGGTAGFIAALASARTGASTMLIERNGYIGGSMISGAGPLHSFFNLYKAFPGSKRQQLVKGLPQELIDRLEEQKASYGHLEQDKGGSYDSVITLVDWEAFKDVAFRCWRRPVCGYCFIPWSPAS